MVHNHTSQAIDTSLCTLSTCPIAWAQVDYDPTLAGNLIYLVIFAILFLAQGFLGIRYRTWGFLVGMFCGIFLEILGYVGRVMMHTTEDLGC